MLQVKKFEFNMLPVNTYVVWDECKEAVVIDAGCYFASEKKVLKEFLAHEGLTPVRLLNTHLHFDHVFGNPYLFQEYGLQAEAHPADLPWLQQIKQRVRMFGIMDCEDPVELKGYLHEGDVVQFGNHQFTIFHVPGHSAGSLVFYCAEEHVLFTGDVLFQYGIGRTDLGDGSETQLIQGIQQKLLSLPDETVVYSGHGPSSTIGAEKRYNIYLR